MKKYFLIVSVICIVFLGGCKRHDSNHSNNAVTCINEANITEVEVLSSVFTKSEIIRLETTDESLIGRNINKIKKSHNKYFISYGNKELIVFDRQGKFLHRINKIGGGPGEYIFLADFDVLSNGNIIILDAKKLLFYSGTGEFIKAVPLAITCFNLKIINENVFLICASGEQYSIYLIDGDGNILSKQLETNNKPVLGRTVAFFALGSHVLYQQDCSNDFLSFNTKTNEFANINLLYGEDRILSIETIKKEKEQDARFNSFDYVERNSIIKIISGISTYSSNLFFVVGRPSAFKCYLMNTSGNTIDYLLTEDTVNDISFTNTFSLLTRTMISDSEDSFITNLYPYQIIDALSENIRMNDHPNYQHLQSLFKDIQNIEDENPVLIELKR